MNHTGISGNIQIGVGNQNQAKNIQSNISSNRAALGGRGLGGIGGSIISSSGINQNFKDYSNGAVKGTIGAVGSTVNPPPQVSNKEQRQLESEQ